MHTGEMTIRPSPADLEAARDAVVADLLPAHLRLLVVGINPGLWTAATGAHFARPGNRFHPALAAAGITDRLIDASAGYRSEDLAHLHEIGLGITNLAPRATARADELDEQELQEGARRLIATVRRHRPRAVAVLGVTAYRTAFGQPRARQGRQEHWPERARELDAVPLFVLPNPSGLNAHASLAALAAAYREAADAAGMERFPLAR